jgi:hypothetical protein
MPAFFDNPMFTSPPAAPAVMRYPDGSPVGLLPPWAYNTPWSPPTAPLPPRPAAAPPPIPPARAPSFPAAPPTPAAAATPGLPPDPTNTISPALANPLASHAATLMALGAGIAQGGIGRGLAMASGAAENERNRQAQQMSFFQTYKALTDGGVPQEEALAAVLNPSLMRSLAAKYLGPRAKASAEGNSSAVAATSTIPATPPGVPQGAVYNPASWEAPDGSLFDDQGRSVPR